MDAVELSRPSDVVVSKFLDGDRAGKAEASGSSRAATSVFGGRKVPRFSSYPTDIKHPPPGCSSDFRLKKIDANLFKHEDMLPNFVCEENGAINDLGEVDKPTSLSPTHGRLNRKSLKRLGTYPCSKKPRTEVAENSIKTEGVDDLENITRHIESEANQLPFPEKFQIVKKKRYQDGKRPDKKNSRASMRTKYDSFVSKAGYTCSDSTSGGNIILGICGLKSNLHGVTKHVDDLSLNELLDGSYKYANICPDKGKKSPDVNENILLSVRKAFSVLSPQGVADTHGYKKASSCLPHPNSYSASMSDSDDKDKCVEDSAPFSKDPFQGNLGNSILFQPKVILEKVALSPVNDLHALLNLSISSPPLQPATNATALSHAGLPPFSWSFSHSGMWKPSVDYGKVASTRNTSHGRWVRIGSNCSSESEPEAFYHNEASINQHKIDDLLQDVKNMTASVEPSFGAALDSSQALGLSAVHIAESSVAFGSSSSTRLHFLEDVDHSEVRGSEMVQKEQGRRSTQDCSDSCYSYPCSSWHLPEMEISHPGYSAEAETAAYILCEMKSGSGSSRALSSASGRTKWPNAPSQKTMKARKHTSSTEKTEFSSKVRHYDPAKSKNSAASKHRPISEKKNDLTHMKTAGREPVRWSDVYPRPSDPVRDASLMPSPTMNVEDCSGLQKLKRAAPKASALGFGGTYIKDWSRGRTKRM